MLVAMTVTLILVFALSQTFAVIGEAVAKGRAVIELSGRVRAVANRLQADLDGLTCPVRPWIDGPSGLGYFEYVEGGLHDTSSWASNDLGKILGDVDDILMFTARSPDVPFVGRIEKSVLTGLATDKGTYETTSSTVAEIIWWMSLNDVNGNGTWDSDEWFTLHRRVLLVLPALSTNLQNPQNYSATTLTDFLRDNDLSVRVSNTSVANSLGDLTVRANRFAHVAVGNPLIDGKGGFPHPVSRASFGTNLNLLDSAYLQSGATEGADVILSHVLAFDVRAFDPTAEIHETSANDGVVPGDKGFTVTGQTVAGNGTFVDLNYSSYLNGANSTLSGAPQIKSQLSNVVATYDTWALDYERDGWDQDGDGKGPDQQWGRAGVDDDGNGVTDDVSERGWPGSDDLVDEGTDGLDNDGKNGVDDVGERETSPPYPVPLRGIQVRIRAYEPHTRQVRQATVVADSIPE
jgi:hypothetical protein